MAARIVIFLLLSKVVESISLRRDELQDELTLLDKQLLDEQAKLEVAAKAQAEAEELQSVLKAQSNNDNLLTKAAEAITESMENEQQKATAEEDKAKTAEQLAAEAKTRYLEEAAELEAAQRKLKAIEDELSSTNTKAEEFLREADHARSKAETALEKRREAEANGKAAKEQALAEKAAVDAAHEKVVAEQATLAELETAAVTEASKIEKELKKEKDAETRAAAFAREAATKIAEAQEQKEVIDSVRKQTVEAKQHVNQQRTKAQASAAKYESLQQKVSVLLKKATTAEIDAKEAAKLGEESKAKVALLFRRVSDQTSKIAKLKKMQNEHQKAMLNMVKQKVEEQTKGRAAAREKKEAEVRALATSHQAALVQAKVDEAKKMEGEAEIHTNQLLRHAATMLVEKDVGVEEAGTSGDAEFKSEAAGVWKDQAQDHALSLQTLAASDRAQAEKDKLAEKDARFTAVEKSKEATRNYIKIADSISSKLEEEKKVEALKREVGVFQETVNDGKEQMLVAESQAKTASQKATKERTMASMAELEEEHFLKTADDLDAEAAKLKTELEEAAKVASDE